MLFCAEKIGKIGVKTTKLLINAENPYTRKSGLVLEAVKVHYKFVYIFPVPD